MKRNVLIVIGILLVISLVVGLIVFSIKNKALSEIELDTRQYINQLEKVRIKGTNDSIIITKQVKWEEPDYGPGVTVSFAIPIPYTITVDGKEYNGIYELNDFNENTMDKNPKYDFQITNLTTDGNIEVLISKK